MDYRHFPLRGDIRDPKVKLGLITRVTTDLVAFCAEEVRRQQDTPWHVYRLVDAFAFAKDWRGINPKLSHGIIRDIGKRVDEVNEDGYRTYPIYIGGQMRSHVTIHADLTNLLDQQDTLTPEQFYYQFELIHPFGDGNGRTGKVLYAWLRDELEHPTWPPDFFGGIENP